MFGCGDAAVAPEPESQPEPQAAAPSEGAPEATSKVAISGARDVHGRLERIGDVDVLHTWGTPAQMGYAHGYLLRERIVEIVDGYALDAVPVRAFEVGRAAFAAAAKISTRRRDEAQGIVDGMNAAGGARIPRLDRALTAEDLLFVNAITDVLTIGCSSLSAWGPSTSDDPTLHGDLATIRNLDWHTDPDLLRNQLVFAFEPDEGEPMLSVGFAGYLGCLSCMNAAGVSVLFNMGYGPGAASRAEAMSGFSPANLTLRDVLERGDWDGDGRSTADDVESALRAETHAGSWIVQVLEPAASAELRGDAPARVLEVEHSGVVARTADDDALGGSLIAATNHMRAMHEPKPCSRYRRIGRTVARQRASFTRAELWALGDSIALDEVVHTLLVRPAARAMEVRLRAPTTDLDAPPDPSLIRLDDVLATRESAGPSASP
jgi:hypothetical protein